MLTKVMVAREGAAVDVAQLERLCEQMLRRDDVAHAWIEQGVLFAKIDCGVGQTLRAQTTMSMEVRSDPDPECD